MDKVNKWLEEQYVNSIGRINDSFFIARPIHCNDGFCVSVQASSIHYCAPRETGAYPYKTVELGYPNMVIEELEPYAECTVDPTGTVYPFVPIELVNDVMEKHGGIDWNYYDRKREDI